MSTSVAVAVAAGAPATTPSESRAERRALISPICVKLSTVGPVATAFWRLALAAWLAYLLLSEPLTAGQSLAGATVLLGIALARRGSRAASTSNEG